MIEAIAEESVAAMTPTSISQGRSAIDRMIAVSSRSRSSGTAIPSVRITSR